MKPLPKSPVPSKSTRVPAEGKTPMNALNQVLAHYESANQSSQRPAMGQHPLPDNQHDCPTCGALSNHQNPEQKQRVMAHMSQNTQQGASGMPGSSKSFRKVPNHDAETDTGEN